MTYCVGFGLHPKKASRYLTEAFLTLASSHGIRIIEVNKDRPLEDQGPFDVIVHKYHSDQDWTQDLEEYSKRHPSTVIVDPIEHIQRLHDRATMLSLLSRGGPREGDSVFGLENISVLAPKQVEISVQWGVQEVERRLGELDLCFPLVMKQKWTDGSDGSHLLALLRNREGLIEALDPTINTMKSPLVIQQFVEHNSTLFKVYVIGEKVICCSRPSLDVDRCLSSFQLLPRVSSRSREEVEGSEFVKLPPEWVTQQVAAVLKEKLKLELFNFDLIKQRNTEDVYFIIDINYFPGIDKLADFEALFVDFLINVCKNAEV